jgi:Universal stress protein family
MAYDLGGDAMTSVMRAGMRISGLYRRNSLMTPSAVNMIIPPAEQILRHAEDNHADMIVMGRRGMTRATRWILGSVSERVMRYAHCPVTVVK